MAVEYLNRGMYDIVEVARLIGRSPDTIARWTSQRGDRQPLLVPEHNKVLFSFVDLVSLDIASHLRRRGATLVTIDRASRFLAAALHTRWPLAHAKLATAGAGIFAELAQSGGFELPLARVPVLKTEAGVHRPTVRVDDEPDAEDELDLEWFDAGQWGQRAFQKMLRKELRPFEYGSDDMVLRWKPRPRIALDPAIQAGAPCVQHTRVPTHLLWELRRAGEDIHDIAGDYDLPQEDVLAAIEWEEHLERAVAA